MYEYTRMSKGVVDSDQDSGKADNRERFKVEEEVLNVMDQRELMI